VMLSNCRVMPVQFRLTSAMSNSITPGVGTDHQSPKRGETQVRQNPLRPSLLAQSSMGKQLNSRNRRKLHVAIVGSKGPQPTRHRIESQAVYKRPGGRLTETRRIVDPYR